MIRFLLRGALLSLVWGGLLFPVQAHAVEVKSLSEPTDPVLPADLINTSPAAQRDPSFGRLDTNYNNPDWRYSGLMQEKTWIKYGLRPPAFAVFGGRPYDPATYPLMKVAPVSRERSSATSTRRSTQTRKSPAKPAAMAPVSAPAVVKTSAGSPSVRPSAGTSSAMTAAPASATTSAAQQPAQVATPYSGPGAAVGTPAPPMPQSVARGAVSPAPAPQQR